MYLQCADRRLDLSSPAVMGILNVTPDSFSDGGKFLLIEQAIEQAFAMQGAGAAIIDIGGESTRPGARPVSEDEELERVMPVIQALAPELDAIISIDTSKPGVMREAVAAGAKIINDVNALRADGALQAAANSKAAVCLMHMQGQPRTMQQAPEYRDVVAEVRDFLATRTRDCEAAGIGRERIALDPGFGFGKTLAHNQQLLRELGQIAVLGQPLLVGLSRKSMLGAMTGRDLGGRMAASIAAAVMAYERGASILRVHDVAETVDALKICKAINSP